MKKTAVASYPSNTLATNLSKETTETEIRSIGSIPKDVFKMQNMNFISGPTNHVEYCTTMFNLPTISNIINYVKKENKQASL